MRRLAVLVGSILAVTLVSAASAQGPVTIQLNEANKSGVSGEAILTDAGNNQTKVEFFMITAPVGAIEPANVNAGQCGSSLGAVAFKLGNVQYDTLTATVNAPIASLQTGGLAINVAASATDATSVACGAIPAIGGASAAAPAAAAAAPAALPASGGVPPMAAVLVAGALVGAGYALRRRAASVD
jgi:hypothetical protein